MTDCATTTSVSKRLTQLAQQACIPLTVTLEITQRCNLTCFHCYNFDRADSSKLPRNELSPKEIHNLIDELAQLGTLFIAFSGGEATIDKNLESYIKQARKHFMRVTVKSNGVAPAGTFARLAKAGAHEFDISLYGASPQTHDAITTKPGSFLKTLAGIQEIHESGAQLRLNFVVPKTSSHEIQLMQELADQYQTGIGFVFNFTDRYDGTSDPRSLSLNKESLKKMYQDHFGGHKITPDFNPNRNMDCACAKTNCGISSTGDVYPCISCPLPSGNIREQSIRQIWETSPEFLRIRQLGVDDFSTCKTCPDKPYCSRSSGNTYTNTQNYTGPDEWACNDAAVRRELYEESQENTSTLLQDAILRESIQK